MKPLYKTDVFNNILVVAHRGDQSNAPENTIESFYDAINSGVDMIESDIQITKDNRFIIHHNSYIKSASKKFLINELTFDEVKKLKIIDSRTNKAIIIPELKDLLSIAKNKVYLNLEIKKYTYIPNKTYIELILNEISNYGDINEILFASFYYDMLSDCKEIVPDIPIAAIRIPSQPLLPEELFSKIKIDAYITSQSSLNKAISDSAIRKNIILASYSIDTLEHFNKAMKYSVKAIATNKAKEIVKIVNNYRQTTLLNQQIK